MTTIFSKEVERVRAEAKDTRNLSRMRSRRASVQAMNGIRLDALYGLDGLVKRIDQAEAKDSGVSIYVYRSFVREILDLIMFVRLLNLADAMNQNQLRLRDQVRRFMKAYMTNDKPALRKAAKALTSVEETVKTVKEYKNTMRFTRDMFKETKPPTSRD